MNTAIKTMELVLLMVALTASGPGCGGNNCRPTENTVCLDDAVWLVDECGHVGEQVEVCEYGCPEAGTSCAACEPTTCEALGRACGQWPDGCDGELTCDVCPAGGICSPDGDCLPGGWTRAEIVSVHAPSQTLVEVAFDPPPGDEVATDLDALSIQAPEGDLEVLGSSWDPQDSRLRIATARQRLGVTYELVIHTGPDRPEDLQANFLAADQATFWASDFSDPNFAEYQVVADRVALGERCVIYLEEGMQVADLDQTVAAFDEQIYPTLTQAYTLAPDVDSNGRIVLLGLDGGNYYGGYYSAVNQYPEDMTWSQWRMHSNEMDMIYLNATAGTLYPDSVIPHEFSHLLYHQAHGFTHPYWDYHDEGLAECAVGLVHGVNQYAVDTYLWDPEGIIGAGLSLVHWTWASYYSYVQAYLFWTYLAAQAGGPGAYGELFALSTGAPEEVDAWTLDRLGVGFPIALRDNLLANWVQDLEGPYGYAGMIGFAPRACPTVSTGTTSVELEAFAGAFFRPAVDDLDYPGTQGGDITYAGIDGDGTVDLTPPFSIPGGALLIFNTSMNTEGWAPQHSGPDVPSVCPDQRAWGGPAPSPAWADPPPLGPTTLPAVRTWRRARLAQQPQEPVTW